MLRESKATLPEGCLSERSMRRQPLEWFTSGRLSAIGQGTVDRPY